MAAYVIAPSLVAVVQRGYGIDIWKVHERTDASGASSEMGRRDTDTPDLTSVRSEGVFRVATDPQLIATLPHAGGPSGGSQGIVVHTVHVTENEFHHPVSFHVAASRVTVEGNSCTLTRLSEWTRGRNCADDFFHAGIYYEHDLEHMTARNVETNEARRVDVSIMSADETISVPSLQLRAGRIRVRVRKESSSSEGGGAEGCSSKSSESSWYRYGEQGWYDAYVEWNGGAPRLTMK